MTEPTPLTFSDEQLVAALKVAPEQLRSAVAIIAMQLELVARRADDTEET